MARRLLAGSLWALAALVAAAAAARHHEERIDSSAAGRLPAQLGELQPRLAALPTELQRLIIAALPHGYRVVFSRGPPHSVVLCASTGVRLELVHSARVNGARFFPSTELVLTWAGDTALAWDATSGSSLREFGHRETITHAEVFPCGDRVVLCCLLWCGSCRVWDVMSGEPLGAFREAPALYRLVFHRAGVEVFPSGDRAVSSSWLSQRPTIWDTASGEAVCRIGTFAPAWATILSGGARILTVGGVPAVWDATTCELLWELPGSAFGVEVLDSGRKLVAIDGDIVTIWSATDGEQLGRLERAGRGDYIRGLSVASRGDHVAVLTDGRVEVWSARTGKAVRTMPTAWGEEDDEQLWLSPHGNVLAASNAAGVYLWDIASGTSSRACGAEVGHVLDLDFDWTMGTDPLEFP